MRVTEPNFDTQGIHLIPIAIWEACANLRLWEMKAQLRSPNPTPKELLGIVEDCEYIRQDIVTWMRVIASIQRERRCE